MPTLFLIEDEATLAKNIARYLERHGWDVESATTAEEALARIPAIGPDVILLDFNLPSMDGLAAVAALRERDPQARIVMLTGHANVQLAVDAMKAGASDFIAKPVVLADLQRVLDKLADEGRLRKEIAYYHARDAGGVDDLIGECPELLALKASIRRVVQVVSTEGGPPPSILITGETGCGKELVARACHFESPRRNGPFIEVNCAAIPGNLLESELFGHERGAFTDAKDRKVGLIEAANGGTLFLDEIGEADLSVQAKLLKVLEDQRIRRLGSVQERHVAVRVIAATNQMLEQRVQEGRFRADLLYRLRVIHFQVPPLRSRGADIQLLATRFIEQFGRRYGKPQLAFTPAALEALGTHTWPGNVRELRNFIEQAVLLAQHDRIDVDDLSLPRTLAPMEPALLADAPDGIELASVEHGLIRRALERSEWNITQAARLLGISRDTLRYRMERHRISREA
jgi:two-component system, NtrC family, response regulator AtoC